MNTYVRFFFAWWLLLAASPVMSATESHNEAHKGAVWVLTIDSAIGPATADYITAGFDKAQNANASLIIIEMNTPGGLDSSMRSIITRILESDIPVATFVTPQGARAASAGTYILYASHIAAMNEATNLGAATPVEIISSPDLPNGDPSNTDTDSSEQAKNSASAMEKKMVNDAAAYIRGLADLRGRNAEWAEQAVREAVSLSAKEAQQQNVIDIVATSIPDLLAQLESTTVKVGEDTVTVSTQGANIHYEAPDWRTELLTILTNPNLIILLAMLGFYGILLEFYNPGALLPGTVGIICLILAGYSMQLLPINYAGLALMLVGVALMVSEAFAPSFGILGIGGIVAFTMGGILLFEGNDESFQIGIPLLAAMGTGTLLLIFITIKMALGIRNQKVLTGVNTMVGETGECLADISTDHPGQVRVHGEIWQAISDTPIEKGKLIEIESVYSLTLKVSPVSEPHSTNATPQGE